MTRVIQDAFRKSSDIDAKEFEGNLDSYTRRDLDAPTLNITGLGIKTNDGNLVKYMQNSEMKNGNTHDSYNIKFYYGDPRDPLDTNNGMVSSDDTRWNAGLCKSIHLIFSSINRRVFLDLAETFGTENIFDQLMKFELQKIITFFEGNDWDNRDISSLLTWEKFLHCLENHKETGEYKLLQSGFNSDWKEKAFNRIINLVSDQASNAAHILNDRSSNFTAIDIDNFRVTDNGGLGEDSMIESTKAIDSKTVRVIFKTPIVPDAIKLDGDVYRPNRSGVMRAFPIYAIDLKFRFNQFPTVRAYRDKLCNYTATHPNISSGSICLGDLKDSDMVTSSEQEGRDGLDIPPLSDFVQTMKMVNLDSAYFGMSQTSHHRIVNADVPDTPDKEIDIKTHAGLTMLRSF